jgi:hypothetical protein
VRYGLILLVLVVHCWSQTTTTGKAETSGSCSPATTGNNNTFTITCTGLTTDQAKSLASIPSVLNKILQKQKDESAEIISRLNDCVEGVKQARKGIYSGYDFNGAKRDQSPGRTISIAGAETIVFHMVDLQSEQRWKELVETSEDQIQKTPGWLTPYLLSGIGNLNLGNRAEGVKRLKYVKDQAGGDSSYADADRILTQLGEN